MKTIHRFMGLLGSLAYLFSACNAFANAHFTSGDLPDIANQAPPGMTPGPDTEYTMKFVKPTPGIDYEIVKASPDPDINYKIRIIGPKSQKTWEGINNRSEGIAQKNSWRK